MWELKVENSKAVLTMRRDTDEPALITQKIKYTDFPIPYIKFFCCDGVIMLPSEY